MYTARQVSPEWFSRFCIRMLAAKLSHAERNPQMVFDDIRKGQKILPGRPHPEPRFFAGSRRVTRHLSQL